jgi:branched-chain amino acid transport system ATP-binding protein
MLSVVNLRVSYGELRVLHGVSIQIDHGTIVSLVGANGSGKSTLINTISGLIRPASGKIFFGDIELTHLGAHEVVRKGVVQVPEGRKLFPQMTVYENLLVGGSNPEARRSRQKTLEQIYNVFPLLRVKAQQLAGTLSGGEQQATAVARGLMSQPKLLMLDEPSLGMAPLLVRETFRNIKMLNARGLTIFLVEQNIKQSLSLCDQGYVLQNGSIVLQGTGKKLLENEFTKKAYLGM